jgi:hypothetical protein
MSTKITPSASRKNVVMTFCAEQVALTPLPRRILDDAILLTLCLVFRVIDACFFTSDDP